MRVIQVLDALDYGDGVSNDVIHQQELLNELGVENQIYSKWHNERVAQYRKDMELYQPRIDDLVLYHFSGKSAIMEQVMGYPGKRIVRYHNVTPPEFFKESNPEAYQSCKDGLAQIQKNVNRLDGFLAVSPFNRTDLISYGAEPTVAEVLPIAMDLERLEQAPMNPELAEQLKARPYFLFVGRVAPNKRFEDLVEAFECYYRGYDQGAVLYLVGNTGQSDSYTAAVMARLEGMRSKGNVIFTGKVSDADLYTYYRGAAAFLCMSEHEGFCIPLLEAMYFDVPVIAYDSCAVPDTMGSSGILLRKKDPAMTADLLEQLQTDDELRGAILEKQRENVARYEREAMKRQWSEILRKWSVEHV